MMKDIKYPRSFSHIGITVPDIHKAVEFYQEVMGWYVIMLPSTVTKERKFGFFAIHVWEGKQLNAYAI